MRDVFRGLLGWFAAHFRSSEDTTDEESRFVPSALDWSVRYAHGGSNAEAEREIASIEDQARQMEKQQRKK